MAAAVVAIALLHADNDGLWFQGDAPRHAMNGFFVWDWLRAFPVNPLDFAVRYYARYPVISPATYPPLFYVVEGLSFRVFGPSPFVAKSLITMLAGLAGLYTMAWARRWISPAAGWAGAILVLMPGMIVWSNAVMLNVPAVALSTAALFHTRRWFEDRERHQLVFALIFLLASLLTYYQSAVTVLLVFIWFVMARQSAEAGWRRIAIVGGLILTIGLVPLAVAIYVAPVQLARHLPTFDRLVTWIGAYIVALSLLPARDPRYVLPILPALAIAIVLTPVVLARLIRPMHERWRSVVVAATASIGLAWAYNAAGTEVPRVSGFREPAVYLRQEAPADAVLYDGFYDGVFGFYMRGLDPNLERRLARGGSLLYYYGQTTTFRWVELPRVRTVEEVVAAIRERCGCRWIALEAPKFPRELTSTQRLLRQAIEHPEFEAVRSFPIETTRSLRIDLYRVRGDVSAVPSFDLTFPSFSARVFKDVKPVSR